MKDYGTAVLVVIFLAIGLVIGAYFLGPVGKAGDDVGIRSGTYQVLAVVEVEKDYALVVLKHEGEEPRYYKIEKKNVLNFEDILVATTVVKVVDGGLKYIEFKP